MQIECRITKLAWVLCRDAANFLQKLCKSSAESPSLLECYAEMPLILCKDNNNIRTMQRFLGKSVFWGQKKWRHRVIPPFLYK